MPKDYTWLIFSIITIILWGFWGFFPKLATAYMDPKSALFWEAVGSVIVGIIMFIVLNFEPVSHPKGAFFAVLTGIFGLLGALTFLFALSKGKASVVITLTALYPVFVIILSFVILGESITLKQGLGILCAFAAMILFAA